MRVAVVGEQVLAVAAGSAHYIVDYRKDSEMSAVADPTHEFTQHSLLVARQQAAQIAPQQIQLPATALEPARDPLSSLGVRRTQHTSGPSSATSCPATRPLVLRGVQAAPDRDLPTYVYDPRRQIATDPTGAPLAPNLKKDWTTIEGTHTDGDGGDNETYDWEEV